ncbi:MAG TPA: sigma-70 family RNA polymerase sigma factor [Labilithrix sp.]|nr:sigma-70 family RNA polymerase sigma factor [Labilithrix sp.]
MAPLDSTTANGAKLSWFRAVFDAEFEYVWWSLRRLGVLERDAEDVAQAVFVEVFRGHDRYDQARPIRPWLFAFAFRFASDYRRLARHRVELLDEHPDPPSYAPLAEDALVAQEARALVARALESIDLTRRAVFILHELDEVPMADVAASLGIPTNTAYSRLRIARKEFTTAVRRLARRGGER